MSKDKIKLFDALREMKIISERGDTFSLKHRKYDRQRDKGGDLVKTEAARLRPKAGDEKIADASRKLFYTDTDTGRARVCWQCLIVEFNGKEITIE